MNESFAVLLKNLPNLLFEVVSYMKEKETTKREELKTSSNIVESITEREKSKDKVSIFKSLVEIEIAKYDYLNNKDSRDTEIKIKELELQELELMKKTEIIKEIIDLQKKSRTYKSIESEIEARKNDISKYLGL